MWAKTRHIWWKLSHQAAVLRSALHQARFNALCICLFTPGEFTVTKWWHIANQKSAVSYCRNRQNEKWSFLQNTIALSSKSDVSRNKVLTTARTSSKINCRSTHMQTARIMSKINVSIHSYIQIYSQSQNKTTWVWMNLSFIKSGDQLKWD